MRRHTVSQKNILHLCPYDIELNEYIKQISAGNIKSIVTRGEYFGEIGKMYVSSNKKLQK